jgi:hypothetical protein
MNCSLCNPLFLKSEWGGRAGQGRRAARAPEGEAASPRLLLVAQLKPVLEGADVSLLCSAAAPGSWEAAGAGVDGGGKRVPVEGVIPIKCFCAELLVVEWQHRDPALPFFPLAFLFAVSPHEPLYDVEMDHE